MNLYRTSSLKFEVLGARTRFVIVRTLKEKPSLFSSFVGNPSRRTAGGTRTTLVCKVSEDPGDDPSTRTKESYGCVNTRPKVSNSFLSFFLLVPRRKDRDMGLEKVKGTDPTRSGNSIGGMVDGDQKRLGRQDLRYARRMSEKTGTGGQ